MGRAALGSLFELAYPLRCGICGVLGDGSICSICDADFHPVDDGLAPPAWRGELDGVARQFHYAGRAEQAVRRLKYARATALAAPMAARLARFAQGLGLDDADGIVPVPIHWTRRFHRGFNQSELLCQGLDSGRVQPHWLRRIRATRQQVGLSPDERRRNLAGAFRASPEVAGRSILLVDDVITSGHTIGECAKALAEAGAVRITALAFAGG